MSDHVRLGPGAEFDAVRSMLERWGPRARGIGDDAAILDVPTGERLVVSTDATVEGIHFRRDWLTPEEIGWRATAAALSDLAAMGAAPLGVLITLTVPRDWRVALAGIADGIGAICERSAAPIVGGDLTEGDRLALAVTVLGHARAPLTRAGARVGDTLYLTGALGGPGAALASWRRGDAPSPEHRERFARPQPRLAAGRWCADAGARAAIDLSDGLAGDVAHLAAASGVRCVVDLGALPLVPGATAEAALASGEEYELLVAAPAIDVTRFATEVGGRLTAIGRVEAGGAGDAVAFVRDGVAVTPPASHDHFAER